MNSRWFLVWLLSSRYLCLSSIFAPAVVPRGIGMILAAVLLCAFSLNAEGSEKFTPFFHLSKSLVLCGMVFLGQSLAIPITYYFGSRYHIIPFLQPLLYNILRYTGLKISSCNGSLFVRTLTNVFKISISLEKLGLYPLLLYLFGE